MLWNANLAWYPVLLSGKKHSLVRKQKRSLSSQIYVYHQIAVGYTIVYTWKKKDYIQALSVNLAKSLKIWNYKFGFSNVFIEADRVGDILEIFFNNVVFIKSAFFKEHSFVKWTKFRGLVESFFQQNKDNGAL